MECFFLVQRLAEFLDPEVKRWSNGKEGNLRALLSTLQYVGLLSEPLHLGYCRTSTGFYQNLA